MKPQSLVCCTLLALLSCGGEAPKTDNQQAAPAPQTAADNRPIVWLEGLYATSSAPVHEVYDLFDDDPSTGWQTLPGSGPDEGMMLYFSNAMPLQAVQLTPTQGSFQGENAFIQLYVNGALAGGGKPGEKIKTGDKPVKSLYIRFVKTGLEQQAEREKDGVKVAIQSYPANTAIGIEAFAVYNDKGESLRLMPPGRVFGSLSASSTLEPAQAYSPANLFDARKEFVWAEGNKTGAGEGETLNFDFGEPVNISAIQIWNGYQRSDEHYAANARLRNFEFGASDGTAGSYTLRDTKAGQKIELGAPVKGRQFTLKINSVYPGSRYKDMVISEMVFFDGDRPFVLASRLPEENKAALRSRNGSSPLVQIFNRRISNLVEEAGVVTEQSIILRSDGTFVMYSNDMTPDGTESETLADGNWELLAADEANATIRVFGKWNNSTDFADYYRGNTSTNTTRIFSDELTTDGSMVKGKKMIGTFYVR
jgi:hypothetical protein